jgi:hypothetical protein
MRVDLTRCPAPLMRRMNCRQGPEMQKPAAVGHGLTELQRSVLPNKSESQKMQELFSTPMQIFAARRNAAVAGVSGQPRVRKKSSATRRSGYC